MSWRSGSKLFCEMWPLIQANIPDREFRIDFTARLLKVFEGDDMDTYDVEDVHPDIRAALRRAGIEIADGICTEPPEGAKLWWHDGASFYVFTCPQCLECKAVGQQF